MHFWNWPLYVGLIIVKIERCLNSLLTAQILLDVVHVESSPQLTQTLTVVASALSSSSRKVTSGASNAAGAAAATTKTNIVANLAVTVAGLNVFVLTAKEPAALVLRVDSLVADSQVYRIDILSNEFK